MTRHPQVEVKVGARYSFTCDELIAPLVKLCWELGLATCWSCQGGNREYGLNWEPEPGKIMVGELRKRLYPPRKAYICFASHEGAPLFIEWLGLDADLIDLDSIRDTYYKLPEVTSIHGKNGRMWDDTVHWEEDLVGRTVVRFPTSRMDEITKLAQELLNR